MELKNILVMSAVVLMFSSCNVKIGQQEDASTDDKVETLDGIWASGCMADSSDSYIKSAQLQNGTLTIATLRYKDTNSCEQNKHDTTVMVSGKFTVIGDSDIEGAKNYEWEIEMIVGIPYQQAMVDDLNAGMVCGSNSWAVGQAAILLGCQVSPNFDLTNVAYGTKHYGHYAIQENVSPLYMQLENRCEVAGYGDLCPTAQDRPEDFDGTVYVKQ